MNALAILIVAIAAQLVVAGIVIWLVRAAKRHPLALTVIGIVCVLGAEAAVAIHVLSLRPNDTVSLTGVLTGLAIAAFLALGVAVIKIFTDSWRHSGSLLQDAEIRFGKMFEEGPVGMVIAGLDRHVISSNPALCRMLGYSAEELAQLTVLEITHPDDRDKTINVFKEMLSGKSQSAQIEKRYIRKDGSVVWGHTHVWAVRDWRGRAQYVFALIRNVSVQVRAEQSLRSSEAKFRMLFEQSGEAIFLADETGRVLDVNPRACEQSGYSREELLNLTLAALIHPEDIETTPLRLQGLQSGVPLVGERRIVRKDGVVVPVEFTIRMLEDGKILGNARDITSRKKQEEQLKTQARLINAVQQAVIATDVHGNVTYWNEGAVQLYGCTEQRALGRFVGEVVPVADLQRVATEIENCLTSGLPWSGEITVTGHDGRTFPVQATQFPVLEDGRFVGSIGISFDISERRQAEQALLDSEQRYRGLFNNMGMGVVIFEHASGEEVSPESLVFVDANPAAERLTGLYRDAVIGSPMDEVLPHANPILLRAIKQSLDTGATEHIEFYSHTLRRHYAGVVFAHRKNQVALVFHDITEHQRMLTALRESELRYRRMVETASEGIWTIDQETRTVFVNQTMADMLGTTVADMMGKKVVEFVFDEDRSAHMQELARRAKGEIGAYDWRFRRSDGSEVWCHISATPLRDEDGRYCGSFGMLTDITARRRAEQELRKSHAQLTATLNALPDLMFELDQDGRVRDYRVPDPEKLYAKPDQFMNRTIYEVLPPEAAQVISKAIAAVSRDGRNSGGTYSLDFPDGTGWFELTMSAKESASGSDQRFIMLVRDVTARKRAEQQLLEVTERLTLSTGAARIGIWDYDFRTNILSWDDIMYQLYGQSPGSFSGTYESWLACLHPDDAQQANEQALAARTASDRFEGEFRIVWPSDGSVHHIRTTSVAQCDESGNPIRLIGTCRDVTGRKQVEEQLRQSRELYRTFIDATSDMAFLKDDQFRYVVVNRSNAAFMGKTEEELIGKTDFDLMPVELAQQCRHSDQAALNADSPVISEEQFGDRFFETIKFHLPFGGGKIGVGGFIREITERKQTERALKQSEERFHKVSQQCREMFWEVDAEGLYLYVSEACKDILGYETDEMVGKMHFYDLHPEEGREEFKKAALAVFAVAGTFRDLPNKAQTRDGQIVWFSTNGMPILDEHGKLKGYVGSDLDITERRRSDEVTQLNAERTQTLLKLNQMTNATLQEITDFGLEEAVRITGSKIGYLAFLNEDESVLTMHSWSKQAMKDCELKQIPAQYRLEDTGLWGEAVRQRKAVITNDYEAPNPLKKGCPNGHIRIKRHMNVPIFVADRIVLVAGLGNKEEEYNDVDVQQLTLLMEGMWRLIERIQAHEALQQSERNYREIFNATSDALFIHDETGRILDVNERTCAMFGLDHDAFLTVSPEVAALNEPPYTSKEANEHLRIALQEGTHVFEWRSRRSNGEVFCSEVALRACELGGQKRIIASVRDITERKRTEQALLESQDQYRVTFEVTGTATVLIEEDTTISLMKAEFARLSGYSKDEVEGKMKWTQFVVPEDLERMAIQHRLRRETTGQALTNYEFRLVTKSGDIRDIYLTVDVIPSSKCSVASLSDITERKRAEANLRASEERFSKAFHANAALMAISSLETGQFVDVNESFLRKLEFSRDEVIGKSSIELGIWIDPEQRNTILRLVAGNGVERGVEVAVRSKSGRILRGLFSAEKIELQSQPHLLTVLNDITDRMQAEEALRDSERRLNQLIDFLPDATFAIDLSGKVIVWNRAIEEMTGASADQMLGRGNHEYSLPFYGVRRPILIDLALSPDEEAKRNYLYVDNAGDTLVAEANVILKGEECALWGIATPLYDREGRVIGALESIRDVTARRRSEEALRKNEGVLQSIFQAQPAGVALIVDRVLMRVNSALCKITGYSEQELLGQSTRILYRDEAEFDRIGIELYGQMRAQGHGVVEAKLRRKDDSVVHVLLGLSPFDPADPGAGVTATVLDITDRKRSEEALKRSYSMLRATLESTADGILVVDLTGRIIGYNQKFVEMWKVPITLINKGDAILLRQFCAEQLVEPEVFQQKNAELYTKPTLESYDLLEFMDGRCFERYSIPQRLDSEFVGRVWSFRDITDRLHAEEERHKLEEQLRLSQKLETIGTLAAGIAHDFNNLLVPVIGYTELADSDLPPDSPGHEHLNEVLKAAYRAKALVGQILTFSRQQSGERKNVHLCEVVADASKLLQSTLAPNVILDTRIEPDLPPLVADQTQLHQVLMNLCVNAAHAMPRGGSLELTVSSTNPQGGTCAVCGREFFRQHLCLRVTDTGHGMDQATLNRIFDPFFTTKPVGEGTGLGLAVTHGIVASHNGHICVSSQVGKGTSFHIYLPTADLSYDRLMQPSDFHGVAETTSLDQPLKSSV